MPHVQDQWSLSEENLRILLLTLLLNLLHLHHNEQERSRRKRRKRMWVHPIVQELASKGHFHVLYQDIRSHPEKFIQFSRISIEAFDRLLGLLSPAFDYEDTVMRRAISAAERLLITLRFLATGESYTSLHLQFRVGKTTISRIVRRTCAVIRQKLQPMVMSFTLPSSWIRRPLTK